MASHKSENRFHFWTVYDATMNQTDRNVTVFEFFTDPEHNKRNVPKNNPREGDSISDTEIKRAVSLAKTALRVRSLF